MGNCLGKNEPQGELPFTRPKTSEEELLDRIQKQEDAFDANFPVKTQAILLQRVGHPLRDTDVIGAKATLALSKDGVSVNALHTLGSGSFGVVFGGMVGNDSAAVKVFNINRLVARHRQAFFKNFPRELAIIKRLDHPNIVTTFRIYLQLGTGRVYIFMERADCDLMSYALNNTVITGDVLDEDRAKYIFIQMATGLNYMHSNLWSHRDIKPENCLVFDLCLDPIITVKLTDFGFARSVRDAAFNNAVMSDTYHVFTESHRPPEVYQKVLYQPLPGDVWSLGVALFILVNHKRPFQDPAVASGVKRKSQTDFDLILQQQLNRDYTWNDPQRWSPEFKDIVARMLEPAVDDRLTMPQVLAHQWLI